MSRFDRFLLAVFVALVGALFSVVFFPSAPLWQHLVVAAAGYVLATLGLPG
jgi:hypothetical protein